MTRTNMHPMRARAVALLALLLALPPSVGEAAAPSVLTLGDGTNPSNKPVRASATNQGVDSFTFNNGTSGACTVTALTVTGTNLVGNVASVSIFQDGGTTANEWDAGDSQQLPTVSVTGNTVTFTFTTPISIAKNATLQFLVTYNLAAAPTNGTTLTGRVTAFTSACSTGGSDATSATQTIDTVAPTTSASATGYTFGNWTSTSPVSVTLTASDGSGSGVATGFPKYCVDTANTCTPGTSGTSVSVTCAAGTLCTQYVRYFAQDNAGNAETVKSSQVRQDRQAPTVTASASGGYTFATWTTTSPITVTLSPSDGSGSGVANTAYCVDTTNTCDPTTGGTSGTSVDVACASASACTQYVRYYSLDSVGNASTTQSAQVLQDRQAPTDGATFTASPVSSAQIDLSWSAASDGAGSGLSSTAAYKVYRATGAAPPACTGTPIYTGTGTSYSDASGLSPGTQYSYRVCAYDQLGNASTGKTATAATSSSAPSEWGSLTAAPESGAFVGSPMAITLQFTSGTAVNRCQYTLNGGSSWTDGVVSGTGPYTCTASGAAAANGTAVTIQMRASSNGGTTWSTVVQSLARTVDSAAPTDGTALTATPASSSQIDLAWGAASDGAGCGLHASQAYAVYRLAGSTAPACGAGTLVYSGVATSAPDTGLSASSQFSYRVCATDKLGHVSAGTTATATTLASTGNTVTVSNPGQASPANAPAGTALVLAGKIRMVASPAIVKLTALSLTNSGTALAVDDVAAVQLFEDTDGSGALGLGTDTLLGNATWNGTKWVVSGLSWNVQTSPRLLFVAVSLATAATATRTFTMSLSSTDVAVESGAAVAPFTTFAGNTVTVGAPQQVGNTNGAAPTVLLLNPINGGTVSGTFRAQAQVYNPGGLANLVATNPVQLSTDGGTTWSVNLAPSSRYSVGANAKVYEGEVTLSPGAYTLVARARNVVPLTTLSAMAVVVVNASGRGDGNLLVRDNSSELCLDCHALPGHSSQATGTKYGAWAVGCRDCHAPHGTKNAGLVRERIQPPNFKGTPSPAQTVRFSKQTGYTTSVAAADATYANSDHTGPCQVCHTRTGTDANPRFRNAQAGGNADDHYTSPTQPCRDCHDHAKGFAGSGSCATCHLGTGDVDSYAWGDAKTARVDTTEWTTFGHGASAAYLSGNAAALFDGQGAAASDRGCAYCHDVTVGHQVSANYFRLANTGLGDNGPCLVCHGLGSTGYDPDGSGTDYAPKDGKKVNETHWTAAHAAAHNGGKYCWDCHDPHGDVSSLGNPLWFMMQKQPVEQTGATGLPQTLAAAIELQAATSAPTGSLDYTDFVAGGLCRNCHDSPPVAHYSKTLNDGHGLSGSPNGRCSGCHRHQNRFEASCSTCHNSPPSPGKHAAHDQVAATPTSYGDVASHATATQYGFGCGKCHAGTHLNAGNLGTPADPMAVEVAFDSTTDPKNPSPAAYTAGSPLASVEPDGRSFKYSDGTCSGTYCHSNARGTSVSVTFNSGTTTCTSCHDTGGAGSALSVAHRKHTGAYAYTCSRCHVGTIDGLGTLDKRLHVDGAREVGFDATGADNHLGTTSGAGDATTCSNTYCHSDGQDRAAPFTSGPSISWGATGTCRSCHAGNAAAAPTMATGKHGKHVANAAVLGKNLGCKACHANTVSDDATISTASNHVNASPDVALELGGTYASPSCTSTYCHSSGQSSPSYVAAAWNEAAWTTVCNKCHGTTNAIGRPDYASGAAGSATANSHLEHATAAADCYLCHSTTVDSAGALSSTTVHVDGARNVSLSGSGTYTAGGATPKSCSGVYCHGTATPQWGGTLACDGCHDASNALDGSHAKHYASATLATATDTTFGSSGTTYAYGCGYCHPSGTANHARGAVSGSQAAQIAFAGTLPSGQSVSGTFTAGGSTLGTDRGFNYTAGTCNSAYCHSNASPLGGTQQYRAPTWGTPLGCNGCHSVAARSDSGGVATDLSNAHGVHLQSASGETGTYAFKCDQCHADTVKASPNSPWALTDTDLGNVANHVRGEHTVKFSSTFGGTINQSAGTYSGAGYTCAATYCHSDGTTTAAPFGSATSIAWNASADVECDSCHGGNATATTTTGKGKLATGKHAKHMDNTAVLGTNYGCAACHATTVSADRTVSDKTKHVDGVRTVSVAAINGKTSGGYTAPNCASNYCHSTGQATPAYQTINWTDGAWATTCNKCHGVEAGAVAGAPWYATGAAGSATANSHSKHVGAAADCVTCHKTTVNATGDAISANGLHTDGLRQVSFDSTKAGSGATYTEGGATPKQCASTYCHGAGTPQWGGATTCASCHKANNTLATPHGKHVQSATAVTATTQTNGTTAAEYNYGCGFCHPTGTANHAAGQVSANQAAQVAFGGSLNGTAVSGAYTPGGSLAGTDSGFNYTAGTCATNYCHSNAAPLGGTNSTKSPAWSGTLACNGCHNTAARSDTAVATDLSNAHGKHLQSASGETGTYTYKCNECHAGVIVSSPNNPWALTSTDLADKSKHVQGQHSVAFNTAFAGSVNQSGGTYDGAGYTCSSTYCHSNGTTTTAPFGGATSIAWNATADAECDSCHGGNSTATTTTGVGVLATGSHTRHVGAAAGYVYKCGDCHNTVVGTANDRAILSTGLALHVNGAKNVAMATGSWVSPTCSSNYCHGSGTPQWNVSAMDCGSCHDGNSALDGSHAKHYASATLVTATNANFGSSGTTYAYGCGFCHPSGSANHAKGTVSASQAAQIALGGTLPSGQAVSGTYTAGGATAGTDRTYNYTAGSCATVYCHSNAAPLGGTNQYKAPTWGTPLACDGCHAIKARSDTGGAATDLSNAHGKHIKSASGETGTYAFRCNECHADTVRTTSASDPWNLVDADLTNTANHVRGEHTVKFSASFSAQTINQSAGTYNGTAYTCASTYCHSKGTTTTTPFLAPYVDVAWNGTATCETCHGGNASATNKMGPSNDHAAHMDQAAYLGTNFMCYRCHGATVASTSDTTLHATTGLANHVDGVRTVSMLKTDLTAGGTYTAASKTCSSVYCHSDGRESPTYKSGMDWDAGQTIANDCKGCHGSDGTPAFTAVFGEPNYANLNTADATRNSHKAHVSATLSVAKTQCVDCHAAAIDATGALKAAGTHLNGAVEITTGGKIGSYTEAGESCSAITCHGGNGAVWGGAALKCGDCHGGASDVNNWDIADGTISKINTGTEWTTYGHGSTSTAGNSFSEFSAVAAADRCVYCHDSQNSGHSESGNPFRLRGASNSSAATAAYSSASAAAVIAVCLNCHSPSATVAYGVDPDGASALPKVGPATARIDSYHYGASDHTATQDGGLRCWDCHDVHGDATNVKMIGADTLRDGTDAHGLAGTRSTTAVAFTSATAGNYVTGTTTRTGVCQVCHTTTSYWRSTSEPTAHKTAADDCISCHGHQQTTQSEAFKGKGGGSDCRGCHGTQGQGARRAVDADFGLQSHHVGNGSTMGGSLTNYDCVVCHAEGMVVTASGQSADCSTGTFPNTCTNPTYHTNGTIDLKDADSSTNVFVFDKATVATSAGAAGNWNSGNEAWRVETSGCAAPASANGCTPQSGKGLDRFCLSCHDANGASVTRNKSAGESCPTSFCATGPVYGNTCAVAKDCGRCTAGAIGANCAAIADCNYCATSKAYCATVGSACAGSVCQGGPRPGNTCTSQTNCYGVCSNDASIACLTGGKTECGSATATCDKTGVTCVSAGTCTAGPAGSCAAGTCDTSGGNPLNPFCDTKITNNYDQVTRSADLTGTGRVVDVASRVVAGASSLDTASEERGTNTINDPPQGVYSRHAIRGQSLSVYGGTDATLDTTTFWDRTSYAWASNTVMGCADCHTTDGANGASGNAHGSGSEYLLKDIAGTAAEGNDFTSATGNYGCFNCHARASYNSGANHTGNASDYQDYTGSTGTSRVPLSTSGGNIYGMACTNCHGGGVDTTKDGAGDYEFGTIHGTSQVMDVGQQGSWQGGSTRRAYRFTNGNSMRYWRPDTTTTNGTTSWNWGAAGGTCYTLDTAGDSFGGCNKHGSGTGLTRAAARPISY